MAATGLLWDYVTSIRTLLSESTDFQTWVGAANATEALDYIWLFKAAPSDQQKFAVVGRINELSFARRVTGNGQQAFGLPDSSALVAFYEYLDPGQEYAETHAETYWNNIGLFVKYFMDNSWESPRINTIQESFVIPENFPVFDSSGRNGYVSAWILTNQEGGE